MAVLKGATGLPERGTGRTSESSDVEIKGTKVFVATEVEDIGWQRNLFDRNPDALPYRALVVRGFIAHNNAAVPIANDEKISGDPRSNVIAYITAVRGGEAPGKNEAVDFGEIVGKAIQVTVSSRPRSGKAGFWLSMKSPAALMEGMPIPECLQPYLTETWEPFEWRDEETLQREYERLVPSDRSGAAAEHPNAPKEQRSAPQPEPPADGPGALMWPGKATITRGVWQSTAPVLRALVDRYYEGDLALLRRGLELLAREEGTDGAVRAHRVLEWIVLRDTGEVAFRIDGRTDPDAVELKDDLENIGAALEIERTADGGEIDPDDLPF